MQMGPRSKHELRGRGRSGYANEPHELGTLGDLPHANEDDDYS